MLSEICRDGVDMWGNLGHGCQGISRISKISHYPRIPRESVSLNAGEVICS